MSKKVLILGGTGMLGSMVLNYLENKKDFDVVYTYHYHRKMYNSRYLNIYDCLKNFGNFYSEKFFNEFDYIINCIGITKPRIDENDYQSIQNAFTVNTLFPHFLKSLNLKNTKIIQICTDCVFSGKSRKDLAYNELSVKDGDDIYGKSKIAGECLADNIINLRTSIIGPEYNTRNFLLEWFLQNESKDVNGYTNHHWNGITTLAFAQICYGIIKNDLTFPTDVIYHINTSDSIPGNSKFDLLCNLREIFNKKIEINAVESDTFCNRTLTSVYPEITEMLWKNAGFDNVPTINYLLKDLRDYMEKSWKKNFL